MSASLTRRQFMQWSGMFALSTTLVACGANGSSTAEPTAEPAVTGPDEALQRLLDGNQRYVNNRAVDPNQSENRRIEVATGQHPFATILGCVDSRVPPEIVFDRGLGDLFVIRTAGQVVDQAVVGSIEFGSLEFGIPLVFVLGHESCGAVTAALHAVETPAGAEGSIGYLVEAITPAIEAAHGQEGDELDNAVKANVSLVVERLKQSPILSEAIAAGKLKIVGGRYDLDKGAIELV